MESRVWREIPWKGYTAPQMVTDTILTNKQKAIGTRAHNMQIKNYTLIVVINWQWSIMHSTVINCKTKLWEMSVRSLPCPCMPSRNITQAQQSDIRKSRLSGYSINSIHTLQTCHATSTLGRGSTKNNTRECSACRIHIQQIMKCDGNLDFNQEET